MYRLEARHNNGQMFLGRYAKLELMIAKSQLLARRGFFVMTEEI